MVPIMATAARSSFAAGWQERLIQPILIIILSRKAVIGPD